MQYVGWVFGSTCTNNCIYIPLLYGGGIVDTNNMTYIEQAIKDASKKGGYDPSWNVANVLEFPELIDRALLDPAFWQALGRAQGWAESKYYSFDGIHHTGERIPEAQWYSRVFWNHIWGGKDAESFFKELLAK